MDAARARSRLKYKRPYANDDENGETNRASRMRLTTDTKSNERLASIQAEPIQRRSGRSIHINGHLHRVYLCSAMRAAVRQTRA